jgi:hypothetical protein
MVCSWIDLRRCPNRCSAVDQTPWPATILRASARKALILETRRDVRVVEGARLESDSGHAHQVIRKHLFAHSIQRLPATRSVSV